MHQFFVYCIVLSLLCCSKCNSNEPGLKIMKSTDDTYIPVSSVVEENSGANFSLLCDLVSSKNNSNYYDFQVSWFKQSNDVRFWREFDKNQSENKSKKIYSILESSEVNKAVKYFHPLRPSDAGKYHCVSLKYGLHETVEVIVRDAQKPTFTVPAYLAPLPCSQSMFACDNGLCIIQHYACDGKADCKDGSDESVATCRGDPCRDKLRCDDGRCIPTSWCCDRHLDPNCTVNNRPRCCQILSNSYEELELGPTAASHGQNGARYLFISIGALCILFVIVLFLLIVSRVMVMARKSDLEYSRRLENIALHNQRTIMNRQQTGIDLIIDNCEVTDPLFAPGRDDQPPPYIDVVADRGVNLNEPPPPYTSREMLNDIGQ